MWKVVLVFCFLLDSLSVEYDDFRDDYADSEDDDDYAQYGVSAGEDALETEGVRGIQTMVASSVGWQDVVKEVFKELMMGRNIDVNNTVDKKTLSVMKQTIKQLNNLPDSTQMGKYMEPVRKKLLNEYNSIRLYGEQPEETDYLIESGRNDSSFKGQPTETYYMNPKMYNKGSTIENENTIVTSSIDKKQQVEADIDITRTIINKGHPKKTDMKTLGYKYFINTNDGKAFQHQKTLMVNKPTKHYLKTHLTSIEISKAHRKHKTKKTTTSTKHGTSSLGTHIYRAFIKQKPTIATIEIPISGTYVPVINRKHRTKIPTRTKDRTPTRTTRHDYKTNIQNKQKKVSIKASTSPQTYHKSGKIHKILNKVDSYETSENPNVLRYNKKHPPTLYKMETLTRTTEYNEFNTTIKVRKPTKTKVKTSIATKYMKLPKQNVIEAIDKYYKHRPTKTNLMISKGSQYSFEEISVIEQGVENTTRVNLFDLPTRTSLYEEKSDTKKSKIQTEVFSRLKIQPTTIIYDLDIQNKIDDQILGKNYADTKYIEYDLNKPMFDDINQYPLGNEYNMNPTKINLMNDNPVFSYQDISEENTKLLRNVSSTKPTLKGKDLTDRELLNLMYSYNEDDKVTKEQSLETLTQRILTPSIAKQTSLRTNFLRNKDNSTLSTIYFYEVMNKNLIVTEGVDLEENKNSISNWSGDYIVEEQYIPTSSNETELLLRTMDDSDVAVIPTDQYSVLDTPDQSSLLITPKANPDVASPEGVYELSAPKDNTLLRTNDESDKDLSSEDYLGLILTPTDESDLPLNSSTSIPGIGSPSEKYLRFSPNIESSMLPTSKPTPEILRSRPGSTEGPGYDRTTSTPAVDTSSTRLVHRITSRPRTTRKYEFDVEKFLDLVANLTYDYYTNLTHDLNKTLLDLGVPPTCSTPTTVTEPTIPWRWRPDYSMMENKILGKCFVCGLEDRGVPTNAHCADAFAGEFIPLSPVDARSKAKLASFRKYCRYDDVDHYLWNESLPRTHFGRWTGGCGVRWTDISGIYTQRTCRNRNHPTTGRHYASKRMAKLEMALANTENGCIISPAASLIPLSRGISLYARFHACVCTGSWCNPTWRLDSDFLVTAFIIALLLCLG